jgi:CTP:molybdopterin cytidylyltransferase MocA
LLALLLLGPLGALVATDFAIARATPFWEWVAREFPRRLDDDYLGEALLRTLPPGRQNIVLLGNSRADDGVDTASLEKRFEARGLRFRNFTVVGSGIVDQAMRADRIAALEPGVVISMVDAAALRPDGWLDETFTYDASAALAIFSPGELVGETGFHVAGLAGQLHVLARHRSALQNSALVRLGRETFLGVRIGLMRSAARAMDAQPNEVVAWLKNKTPDPYPNASTRALTHLARRMRSAGAQLVVVEAPAHPILIAPAVHARVERFRGFVSELATAEHFTFVPATRLEALDVEHFRDLIHVNADGRARFTATLGDALETVLPEPTLALQ